MTTGDTQGALGEVRLLELVPDLATKYLDKITTRRSFAVSTSAEMRVLAEVMDSLMAGHVGRAGDIMAQRFRALEYVATEGRIVEQSEPLGTGPSGRGHVSHPRTVRRHESPGAPRSTVDRKTKQLGLKRARSESQPTGREGRRQGRNPVEVARREPVRERKQKGEQDLGEHRTDSWQQRVAGWEETQTGVGACSESGKRQTLNEEPPVRVSGCLRGVVGFATFPRKVLFLSTVCTSGGRMVLSINRKGGGTRSSPTHVRVSKDSKRCWTPTSST